MYRVIHVTVYLMKLIRTCLCFYFASHPRHLFGPKQAGSTRFLFQVSNKHNTPVYFRPSKSQFHPKTDTLDTGWTRWCAQFSAVRIAKTRALGKQTNCCTRVCSNRRDDLLGQASALHQQLKAKGHILKESRVAFLPGEDEWLERAVRKAIFVDMEEQSLTEDAFKCF